MYDLYFHHKLGLKFYLNVVLKSLKFHLFIPVDTLHTCPSVLTFQNKSRDMMVASLFTGGELKFPQHFSKRQCN